MDESTVVTLLQKRKGERTLKETAEEVGVSLQYLQEVLTGKKRPSDRILEYLGLKRDIVLSEPKKRRAARLPS